MISQRFEPRVLEMSSAKQPMVRRTTSIALTIDVAILHMSVDAHLRQTPYHHYGPIRRPETVGGIEALRCTLTRRKEIDLRTPCFFQSLLKMCEHTPAHATSLKSSRNAHLLQVEVLLFSRWFQTPEHEAYELTLTERRPTHKARRLYMSLNLRLALS